MLVVSGAATLLGFAETLNTLLSPSSPLRVLVPNLPHHPLPGVPPSSPGPRPSLSSSVLLPCVSPTPPFPSLPLLLLPSIDFCFFSGSPILFPHLLSLGCVSVPLWLSLSLSAPPSPSPVTSCSPHLEPSFFLSLTFRCYFPGLKNPPLSLSGGAVGKMSSSDQERTGAGGGGCWGRGGASSWKRAS